MHQAGWTRKGCIQWQLLAFGLISCSAAFSNPSDPLVKCGSAKFENIDGRTLAITTSDKALINWNEFSIAEGELTQFFQPSSSSLVVNKVTSELSSILLGSLKANGNVYLINPSGILIGENGSIDTNSFIASTLPVCPHALLNGNEEVLFEGVSKAKITNLGRISALEGDVILISYQIDNPGTIEASNGTAAFGAGRHVLLRPLSTEKIVIRPTLVQLDNQETGIDNSGVVAACRAELKADGNAYAMAINHTGSVDAFGVLEQNGEVFLVSENGKNGIAGTISAKNVNGTGGSVQILGENIVLFEESWVDTSGEWGGGPILIGGDLSGKNPDVINAQSTFVCNGAQIISDATIDGTAGQVIVWADLSTHFYGKISARGGENSGDGGFVEISGKHYLDFQGVADRFAPNGKSGTLLLDPTDITYNFNVNQYVTAVSPFQPDLTNCPSEVASNVIDLALSSGDVIIQSSGGVPPNPCTSTPGNVFIDTTHTIASNFNLTFNTVVPGVTAGDVILNAGRTLTNNGPGNVSFISVQDIDINGSFVNNGAGSTTLMAGQDININAGGGIFTSGPMTFTATRDVNVTGGDVNGSGTTPFTITAGRDFNCAATASNFCAVQMVNSITATRDFTITGNGEFAQVNNLGPIGPVTMTAMTGNLTLQGGVSNVGGHGFAILNSPELTVNVPQGNIVLQGGGPNVGDNIVRIIGDGSGQLNINCGGSITIQGGSGTTGNSTADIDTTAGSIFITAGGPINLIGGTAPVLGNNALIITQLGGGDINITTPSDVNLTSAIAPNMGYATISPLSSGNININANNVNLTGNNGQSGIATFEGSISITAVNAVNLTPGPGFSSSYISAFNGTAPHSILVIAGTDIFMGTVNSLQNSLIQNFNPGGALTLVCDNDFPIPPFFGPGKFTNFGTVSTVSAPLWVFTSRRFLNSTGDVNVPFVPGPIYVDSTSERWFTWYNNTSNGTPYKIFYKDLPTPTPIQMQTALTNFNAAAYEFLQNLQNYDVFWYWRTKFSSEYDKSDYNKFHHHDALTSSDVFGKKIFHLLRKSYKEQNGKVIYLIK